MAACRALEAGFISTSVQNATRKMRWHAGRERRRRIKSVDSDHAETRLCTCSAISSPRVGRRAIEIKEKTTCRLVGGERLRLRQPRPQATALAKPPGSGIFRARSSSPPLLEEPKLSRRYLIFSHTYTDGLKLRVKLHPISQGNGSYPGGNSDILFGAHICQPSAQGGPVLSL